MAIARRMFLVVCFLALSAVAGPVKPVAAACSDAKLTIYGSPNYTEGSLVFCYPNGDSWLGNNSYNFSYNNGLCPRYFPVPFGDNWDNCASSYKWVSSSCHFGISIWADSNYSGLMWSHWGGSYNRASFPVGYEDAVTSISFKYRSSC